MQAFSRKDHGGIDFSLFLFRFSSVSFLPIFYLDLAYNGTYLESLKTTTYRASVRPLANIDHAFSFSSAGTSVDFETVQGPDAHIIAVPLHC